MNSNGNHHVLMLSYPFPPAMSGGVFRILRFAKFLPEFGWEPIVVTPKPESVYPITVDDSLERLIPRGLHVERTTVLRPLVRAKAGLKKVLSKCRSRQRIEQTQSELRKAQSDGAVSAARRFEPLRAIRELEGLLFATPDRHVGWLLPAVRAGLRVVRRDRPRVIYSTGPPHSSHLIALALKRITGLPVVIDFRDPWAAREWSTKNRASLGSGMTGLFEKLCVRTADRVVLNTPALRELFVSTYGATKPDKFCAIPNGFDPSLVSQVDELVERHGPSGANGVVKLCHAGSAWGKRDLRPLAEAMKIAASRGQHVEMEQVGSVNPNLRPPEDHQPCDSNGTIRFLGEVSHEEALRRMARANILVLIQPDNTLQIPGKLYEMLPFRKPILALTGKGATGDVVEKFGIGEVVDPGDPQAIAAAIDRIARNNVQERHQTSHKFDNALSEFDGRTLTRKLADVFDSVIAK